MSDLTISAFFTQNGSAAIGLTLAEIDLYLVSQNISTGSVTIIWDGTQHPTTEITNMGKYSRILSGADLNTYNYHAKSIYTGVTILDANETEGEIGEDHIGVWTILTSALTLAGSIGKLIVDFLNVSVSSRSSQASVDVLQVDTDDIQTRLPATLDGGNMRSSVKAMDTDVVTSTVLAASAVAEIQAGLSTATAAQIAAAILKKGIASLENDGDFETASIGEIILAHFESSVLEVDQTTGNWIIRKTDGTTFNTRPITLDANALPIKGVT